MKQGNTLALIAAALFLASSGCQRPMFPAPGADPSNPSAGSPALSSLFQRLPNGQVQNLPQEQARQLAELSRQLSEVTQQLSRFDADNQGLHAQVAALQQKLDNANNYNYQLKQQLGDATAQLQQLQQSKQQLEQRLAGSPGANAANPSPTTENAPYRLTGSATLRANNSLMGKLSYLQSLGGNAWMDGDVIRVDFAADTLFAPGSYQLQSTQQILLNQLASTIRQQFPKQFVGIEGHWDNSQVQGATSLQQLTATQALAVFNHLVQAGLPEQQLFTVGMGSSRPRFALDSPKNRRIEIVIYPETFGDR